MRPDRILELRAEWPDAILSGYYSDGRTWISVDLDADLPESLVLDLCDMSYALVFAKLPRSVKSLASRFYPASARSEPAAASEGRSRGIQLPGSATESTPVPRPGSS